MDIEIEPHADRVGRHEMVDIAVLEQFDLGIARPRAERSENDGRTAPLATDQLGNRIDLVRREGDDRRARRQAGHLLRSGIFQHGHARAGDDVEAREQLFQEGPRGRRAQEQRFGAFREGSGCDP